MKCPVCKNKIKDILADECPYCKTKFDDVKERKYKTNYNNEKCNADILNVFANINLIISIIVAIFIWIRFSVIEKIGEYNFIKGEYAKTAEINWCAILGGIGIIFSGLTLYFTLKTIIDIFDKVDN